MGNLERSIFAVGGSSRNIEDGRFEDLIYQLDGNSMIVCSNKDAYRHMREVGWGSCAGEFLNPAVVTNVFDEIIYYVIDASNFNE